MEDVCQPDGGEMNYGNYGRWNFGMGGPGKRDRLIHGEIGGIISTPGCYDQKIHADIPHLFNVIDIPPHLLHAFMPACVKVRRGEETRKNSSIERFKVGQTAFVIGSHKLSTCARMMNEDKSGVMEAADHLIRPHLEPGDAILFDCRILHLGLANESAPLGSKGKFCPIIPIKFLLVYNYYLFIFLSYY